MSRALIRLQTHCRRCFCSQHQQSTKIPSGTIRSVPKRDGTLPSSAQLGSSYMRSASAPIASIPIDQKFNLFIQSLYKSYQNASFLSKLFYGSLISLILFGDYLDRQFIERRDKNGIYSFLAESPEDSIMELCKTGDVVVFQRPLLSFNPLNILRTSFRQFACGGPYDHCGIIIANGYDNNFPYIVEIDQNYYNKLRITPFDERILTAREAAVFIRQIQRIAVPADIRLKFSDWIDYTVNGEDEPHNQKNIEEIEQFIKKTAHKRDSMFSVLLTLAWNGDNTVKIRSSIRDLTRKIKQNEYEITTQINEVAQAPSGVGMRTIEHSKRHGRVKNTDELIKDTRMLKLQRQLKKDNLHKRLKKVKKSRKINSAQFVGYTWRYMKLLPDDGAKPWEIRPQHFADSKIEIPMFFPGRLGHVQFVKTANEDGKINDAERRYRGTTKNPWEAAESGDS